MGRTILRVSKWLWCSSSGDYTTGYSHKTAVGLWDVATGEKLRTLPFDAGMMGMAIFSPDGRQIACSNMAVPSSGSDMSIVLWDTETGKRLRSLQGDGVPMAFSPDGRWLVGWSQTRHVTVWNVDAGQQLVRLLTLDNGKRWLAVTPDGHFDGSPKGRQTLAFRIGDGLDIVPVERFQDEYYRPGLLKKIFEHTRKPSEQ